MLKGAFDLPKSWLAGRWSKTQHTLNHFFPAKYLYFSTLTHTRRRRRQQHFSHSSLHSHTHKMLARSVTGLG